MSKEAKSFLEMLNKEFNINDLFEKYGNGGYSNKENVPGRWVQPYPPYPNTHEPYKMPQQPFRINPPYQGQDYNDYIQNDEAQRDFNKQLDDILKAYQDDIERNRKTEIDRIGDSFKNAKSLKDEEKINVMKNAFLALIKDKINFDIDGNLIDENGNAVKSIGQFGLMFMRILNAVIESKRSAEQNENDLKGILK